MITLYSRPKRAVCLPGPYLRQRCSACSTEGSTGKFRVFFLCLLLQQTQEGPELERREN